MTEAQARAVEYLRRAILANDGLGGRDDHEYKSFKTAQNDYGTVYVTTTVGLIGDEDTAAWLCRVHRHIAIGPRGGMRLLNPGRYNKATGRIVPSKARVTGRAVAYTLTV